MPNPALAHGPLEPTPTAKTESGARRWFALALAAIVYVVGIAGLWSMVQTFDQRASLSLTPAGDGSSLPPIEDEIDVRDARLDGPFIPRFRPSTPFGPNDIAATNLQTRG